MDLELYEQRRYEFSTPGFRKELKRRLRKTCANCGCDSKERLIEYHHIVPLIHGGTNKLSNIVPLCEDCHIKAHGSKKVRKTQKGIKGAGRPRIVPPNDYRQILDRYMHGEISQSECKFMLNIADKAKLTDMLYYHDYLEELGLKSCRNHLDHIEDRDNMPPDRVIAYVVYKNGSRTHYLADGSVVKGANNKKKRR